MPDITILPANLTTLVLESCLYGILLLLFISTVYFLATRRTLAGHNQTARHQFTSLVFLGVTSLFMIITVHWAIVIYQAFFAFIHLGSAKAEDAFYADLAQRAEIVKVVFFSISVLLGDSLVIYRLWIIWGRNRNIVIFPICSSIGLFVAFAGILNEFSQWEPRLRGTLVDNQSRPWTAIGYVLSLMQVSSQKSFIAFRISRATVKIKSAAESRLMPFLVILVESAALQTFWLTLTAITIFAHSDAEFIASDTFPVIIGIVNLLIHARVGLGWSQDSAVHHKSAEKNSGAGMRSAPEVLLIVSPGIHDPKSHPSTFPTTSATRGIGVDVFGLIPG
ncbi:hypothetical protein C8R44DRAFT_774536 [Mycena epipterygia]|nr:hypothetical protein C8R44DRAFT_774536 [Mycena epipterygia]